MTCAIAEQFALRPYQTECLSAIADAASAGVRRQLVVMATGAGKTIIFSHLPGALGLRNRMLVLAHREELLDQAARKIAAVNPSMSVAVEQASRQAGAAQAVVASVASIGRRESRRLNALRPSDFGLIVIDEAHHAPARSYMNVLAHFGVMRPIYHGEKLAGFEPTGEGPVVVGVTATEQRGDGAGLSSVFERVVYERHLRQMIEEGWLVRLRAYRAESGTDLTGVRVSGGDFATSDLANAINTPARNALTVRAYQLHALDRKAIAFCADVQHAVDLAETFREEWISAEAIHGGLSREDRRAALERFRSGETMVLTSCMVLTEGFDEPSVGCVLMCRPTKSQSLYLQMMGRGTRLFPGKTDVVVVDVADVTRHGLPSVASIVGLPPKYDCLGGDVLEQAEQLELLERTAGQVATNAVSLADARNILQEVDLMRAAVRGVRDELRTISQMAWLRTSLGVYYLPLPDRRSITVRENALGLWAVHVTHPDAPAMSLSRDGAASLQCAIALADGYVQEFEASACALTDTRARWRKRPATEAQMKRLGRRYVPGMTCGEATDMIQTMIARRQRFPVGA